MHLWPSTRLRDSFKSGYLKKLEWNLLRMQIEKKNQSQTTKLLDDNTSVEETSNSKDATSYAAGTLLIFRELVMVLSCCYCCFCCGGCSDAEEK